MLTFQRSEGRWFVQSETDPEVLYLVKRSYQRPNGIDTAEFWACNCWDNIYRGRDCKHIRAVKGQRRDELAV